MDSVFSRLTAVWPLRTRQQIAEALIDQLILEQPVELIDYSQAPIRTWPVFNACVFIGILTWASSTPLSRTNYSTFVLVVMILLAMPAAAFWNHILQRPYPRGRLTADKDGLNFVVKGESIWRCGWGDLSRFKRVIPNGVYEGGKDIAFLLEGTSPGIILPASRGGSMEFGRTLAYLLADPESSDAFMEQNRKDNGQWPVIFFSVSVLIFVAMAYLIGRLMPALEAQSTGGFLSRFIFFGALGMDYSLFQMFSPNLPNVIAQKWLRKRATLNGDLGVHTYVRWLLWLRRGDEHRRAGKYQVPKKVRDLCRRPHEMGWGGRVLTAFFLTCFTTFILWCLNTLFPDGDFNSLIYGVVFLSMFVALTLVIRPGEKFQLLNTVYTRSAQGEFSFIDCKTDAIVTLDGPFRRSQSNPLFQFCHAGKHSYYVPIALLEPIDEQTSASQESN